MNTLKIAILFLSLLNFQTACAQHNDHKQPTTQTPVDLGKVDKSVKKQIDALLTSYYAIKDALVGTNGVMTKEKAGEFVKNLATTDNTNMTDSQKEFWTAYSEKLKLAAVNMSETDQTEKQREHFENLSNDLYIVIKSFGANAALVYRQFCPMAFDDKGAFWLSDKKEVRNPYFGDKMLKCGSVKEEF